MRNKATVLLMVLLGVVLGLALSGVYLKLEWGSAEGKRFVALAEERPSSRSPEELAELQDFAGKLERLFEQAAEAVKPAVVSIRAAKTIPVAGGNPLEDFSRPPGRSRDRRRKQVVGGSGVILNAEGFILTNNHVVADATDLQVTLAGGRTYEAELMGTDEKTEVAIIRIKDPPEGMSTAVLGDSEALHVGQWVLAIGHPFGLQHTVSAGIVSATGRSGFRAGNLREVEYQDWIQTDAAINPGNSGGPLVNLRGEVIGINTFIFSQAGGNMGIGFAIPANIATDVIPDLMAGREVVRGYLGVFFKDLTAELAESFEYEGTSGALVNEVQEDSPADDAGIEAGDIIMEFEGHKIEDGNELRRRVAATGPGTRAKVKVWRDGKGKTFTVKLGDLATVREEGTDWLGVTVHTLTRQEAKDLGTARLKGVQIDKVDPESIVADYLEPTDVILSVGRTSVTDAQDYLSLMERVKPGQIVRLYVWDHRTGRLGYLTVRRPPE